jgi:predicted RecB family nuclease
MRTTCSRGHRYEKSSHPVCPICWPGYYKARDKDLQGVLPGIIPAPALRALLGAQITTLAELSQHTEIEIQNLHGMGPKALAILKKQMRTRGLSFKNKVAAKKS